MIDWAVPWPMAEIIDTIFLIVATIIVTAVPTVYGIRANLHDPLARAVIYGTGATAVAFIISLVFTFAIHAGWQPSELVGHWIARGIYASIALGKLMLLLALLRVLKAAEQVSRNQPDNRNSPVI